MTQAGFTLLEVLVALIIFAIAFGALASIFQTSLRQTTTAEALRKATLLAETQLARFGKDQPLELGKTKGVSAEGMPWRAEVSLARPIDENKGLALYRIIVEAGGPNPVELQTFRLSNRP